MMSIYFHLWCLESYSQKVPMDNRYLKNVRRKNPDCLADSCKHSSVNQMAAGSRLQAQVMDFFFFHFLFKHVLCSQV